MTNTADIIDDLRLLEPTNWLAVWMMILGALVTLGIVALVLYRRRRIKRDAESLAISATHAHEEALAALEKARALLAPETSRPYGIEVSSIVRRYIERRFGIVAPRRSTEEFLLEAAASPQLAPAHRQLLADFLGTCDFLKFARARAEVAELEAEHAAAVRFVSETRVVSAQEVRP